MTTTVVKTIFGQRVMIGGAQHSGWLPERATIPPATPIREVALDLEIQFDGSGYNLRYVSEDRELYGDTWHETLDDAMAAAAESFGVRDDQWQTAVDSSPG